MIRLAIALLLCCGATLRAQPSRAPVVSSVDLLVPWGPAAVPILGTTRLVHELHVTNFQSVEVTLRRVEVLNEHGALVAGYEGDSLDAITGRPGLRRDHPTPRVVAPGMRAVVYFWIELAPGEVFPSRLRHRVELELAGATPVRTTVIGAETALASGRQPVVLRAPLQGGPWVAIYDPQLRGGHRTTFYSVDGRSRIPGRFAVDFVKVTSEGTVARDAAAGGAQWNGFGAPVLAVADAIVADAPDDMPDQSFTPDQGVRRFPPEQASGNHVTLDLGGGRFAFYEHLQSGSIQVRKGDRVRAGQVIARLGYSGSSSSGPHLHFHVADANSDLGAEGMPFVFAGFEHLGAFSSLDALARGERWKPNAAGRRRDEHPAASAVIRFAP